MKTVIRWAIFLFAIAYLATGCAGEVPPMNPSAPPGPGWWPGTWEAQMRVAQVSGPEPEACVSEVRDQRWRAVATLDEDGDCVLLTYDGVGDQPFGFYDPALGTAAPRGHWDPVSGVAAFSAMSSGNARREDRAGEVLAAGRWLSGWAYYKLSNPDPSGAERCRVDFDIGGTRQPRP